MTINESATDLDRLGDEIAADLATRLEAATA